MKNSNTMETITVKEEPIDVDLVSGEEDNAVDCRDFCSAQYEESASSAEQSQPKADPLVKTELSVKAEPPDNSKVSKASETCSSNTTKKDEIVEPLAVHNLYSAKCELICEAENEGDGHSTEPQPTPSTSTASKATDNFEFISVGAIKQEKPEWTSDTEEADPNPLQDDQQSTLQHDDQQSTLQQDYDPDHHRQRGEFECRNCLDNFSRRSYLFRQSRTYNGQKRFRCEFCRKVFILVPQATHREDTFIKPKPKTRIVKSNFGPVRKKPLLYPTIYICRASNKSVVSVKVPTSRDDP